MPRQSTGIVMQVTTKDRATRYAEATTESGWIVRKLYVCKTEIGPTHIVLTGDGQFDTFCNGETLAAFSSPQQAVDDIASKPKFSTASGIDPAILGVPEDLTDWERC